MKFKLNIVINGLDFDSKNEGFKFESVNIDTDSDYSEKELEVVYAGLDKLIQLGMQAGQPMNVQQTIPEVSKPWIRRIHEGDYVEWGTGLRGIAKKFTSYEDGDRWLIHINGDPDHTVEVDELYLTKR